MGLFKQTKVHESGGYKTTKVSNKKTGLSKTVRTKVGSRPSKSGLSKKRK